ncbi:hypothetical protein HER32_02945 [Hymenobacter sp. BT18]|uniref:carbonic anhydrase n=1 Tax=Hymenobacter sp. BT18 TaxID=2835648 RepID=UPI00143E2806|nr:carbonic anhydrase [Hymenobacter sp. BT18]QIX60199.1 hypothetical protein HER32_02945 [Hymenobacter sp. BT18]
MYTAADEPNHKLLAAGAAGPGLRYLLNRLLLKLRQGWTGGLREPAAVGAPGAAGPRRQVIRLGRNVSFLQKASLLARLSRVAPHTILVLDGTHSVFIDPDILGVIELFRERARPHHIQVLLLRQGDDYARSLTETTSADPRVAVFAAYYSLFVSPYHWVAAKLRNGAASPGASPRFLFVGYSEALPEPVASGLTGPEHVFASSPTTMQVVSTPLGLDAVLRYAVHTLHVDHLVLCGHCGRSPEPPGATRGKPTGKRGQATTPEPLAPVLADVTEPEAEPERSRRLVSLRIIEQVYQLQAALVTPAGQPPVAVHGWVYDEAQGMLHDLAVDVRRDFAEYDTQFRYEVAAGGLRQLPGDLQLTPFLYAVQAAHPAGTVLAVPPLVSSGPLGVP